MSLGQRLSYAATLSAVLGAAGVLLIFVLSADGIHVLPADSTDLVFSPIYPLVVFVLSCLIAPMLSKYVSDSEP